jgi:paraquat-inducible protein A
LLYRRDALEQKAKPPWVDLTRQETSAPVSTPLPLDNIIACPKCDALYSAVEPANGERAVCGRCHMLLIAPRRKAGKTLIALALTMLVLIIGAAMFPFLEIRVAGLANKASILDAGLAFDDRRLLALAAATIALILLFPAIRAALLLYVLIPVAYDRPPYRHARKAFRLSEVLRPWSMAEIFALGCAVSLIKVGDLASVEFGAAFWMFAAVVIIVVLQDRFLCRWSVWASLDTPSTS